MARLLRIGVWSLLGLVALVVAAGAIFALSFDPDSLKPRIIAAVKQATGRDLTLQGHMRLGLSLQPTVVVQGVSLANPPGFSRPQMVTLERLDVKLALIPLLSNRVEIDRLVLVKPDIILETDPQGRPNWQFSPPPKPTAPQSDAGAAHDKAAARISVADVRIENGTLTWRDDRVGRSAVIGLTSLHASAPSPDANLSLTMSASYDGAPFSLTGAFGPLTRREDTQAGAAWPVQASLEAGGAKLAVDGAISQPMQARGYRLKLAASIPDLRALAPYLPAADLPPLHDVSLAAQVADTGSAMPDVSNLVLHVGPSDLGGVLAGLKLDRLELAVPHLDQPAQVSAQGSLEDSPASLTGSVGVPVRLLAGTGTTAPIPLDLIVQALGSNLTIKGTARGQDGRPAVQAEVASDKLDLDRLLAALPKPVAAAGTGPTIAPTAAPAKPPASSHVIPDWPIRFDLLRSADVDARLIVAEAIWGGATYRAITTHLVLHAGRLRVEPFSADLPEGHLDATLSADASQPSPAVALTVQSPALAVQPLLVVLRQPAYLTGNLQVHADLRGSGATPHAITASLAGSLVLSMVGGTIDNRVLGGALGSVLRGGNLLDLVGRGGTSQVQCFAARLDASNGIATLRSLVLASSLLTLDANGTLNLGAETLDLRVRPQARVAGTGLVFPLRVSGSFRSPSTTSDTEATIGENAEKLLGSTNPLGSIAGALTGRQVPGETGTDCGAPSAAAHGAPAVAPPKPPNLGGVLRQLFR